MEPDKSDLIINEILTDPFVGGEDFIELYNRSQKFIQVKILLSEMNPKEKKRLLIRIKYLDPENTYQLVKI